MKTRSLATRCVFVGLSVALLGMTACGIEDESSEEDDPSAEQEAAQNVESANEHGDKSDLARITPCVTIGIAQAAPGQPFPFPNDPTTPFMVPIGANGGVCSLLQGDHNGGVFGLQRALSICYGQAIALDSDFGPLTKAALARAQRVIGVPADGEYGPVTHAFMKFPRFDNAAIPPNCMRVL
jgi:peptidoglycan hydrolase-like protein with peptidoglycan-binding domain